MRAICGRMRAGRLPTDSSMRLRSLSFLVVVSLASGCAHDRGWTGEGAMPFDSAQADCDAKTRDLDAGKTREDAFDACMAGHGWKPP